MRDIDKCFITTLFLITVGFAHGQEFYEVYDFPEAKSRFEENPPTMFEYDRDGVITIHGLVGRSFRLPGLPHENNHLKDSDARFDFYVKAGSSCQHGIGVCFNVFAGYPENCDMEIIFYTEITYDGIIIISEKINHKTGSREILAKDQYSTDVDNWFGLDFWFQDYSFLVGGSVPKPDPATTCGAELKFYGDKVPRCIWRWQMIPELVCDNRFGDNFTEKITEEVTIGWSYSEQLDEGGKTVDSKSLLTQGTHTESNGRSGEFKPSFGGFGFGGIDYKENTDNTTVTSNGWDYSTTKSWNDVVKNAISQENTITKPIDCKPGTSVAWLQKVWRCDNNEIRTGLVQRWDMSVTTKEEYKAWITKKPKKEIILLADTTPRNSTAAKKTFTKGTPEFSDSTTLPSTDPFDTGTSNTGPALNYQKATTLLLLIFLWYA